MIISPHSVIFLFQPQPSGGQADLAIRQLQANGLQVVLCSDLQELYSRTQSYLAQEQARPGCWAMLEQGWVLAGPQQQRIALTTGERAFLTTLFAQPGLRASHKQLIDALNSSYTQDLASSEQARLVLLVSRLRRKLREHGAEAPLKSMHRWGYMFAGPVL